jgi:hypothetical protein
MSTAALLTPIGHVRSRKRKDLEAAPLSAATPGMLRSVAHELKCSRSKQAFRTLVDQFERHAAHLEKDAEMPTMALTEGLVTITETAPLGKVLMVPAPACDHNTIGTHIAAALTAGNQISMATFAPMDGIPSLFSEVLAGVLATNLFTVLSPGSGWEAPGQQSVVVVTPDAAFANDLPWWKHHSGTDDPTDIGELIRFYGRSSTFHVPFRTSPYRGFTS